MESQPTQSQSTLVSTSRFEAGWGYLTWGTMPIPKVFFSSRSHLANAQMTEKPPQCNGYKVTEWWFAKLSNSCMNIQMPFFMRAFVRWRVKTTVAKSNEFLTCMAITVGTNLHKCGTWQRSFWPTHFLFCKRTLGDRIRCSKPHFAARKLGFNECRLIFSVVLWFNYLWPYTNFLRVFMF